MKLPLLIFLGILLSFSVHAQVGIEISLKNNTEAEKKTKHQLERLLKDNDFSRWIFTKKIVIDEKTAIPHSHPVLTLNTRNRKDDELLASTFVHEQIHWHLDQNQNKVEVVMKEIRIMFPDVPKGPPNGAQGESSTYLHIPVIFLEYIANLDLFGQLKARQIMEYWSTHHYKWIYKTVLNRYRDIGRIVFKHKLAPRRRKKQTVSFR